MKERHNVSILMVDDDISVLESGAELLKEHGYSVITSENADDAMDKLQANEVDVVVADIRMPQVSGLELLEKIHSTNSNMPVILMTAYAELDVAITAMGKGAFDFIIKPYKQELLLHAIEMAIKQKKLNL